MWGRQQLLKYLRGDPFHILAGQFVEEGLKLALCFLGKLANVTPSMSVHQRLVRGSLHIRGDQSATASTARPLAFIL